MKGQEAASIAGCFTNVQLGPDFPKGTHPGNCHRFRKTLEGKLYQWDKWEKALHS